MLNHTNHAIDSETFKYYPENMRIDDDKMDNVKKMISIGVDKRKLKVDLMADGKKIISSKTLHNIQTKLRLEKQNAYEGDGLQKLLSRLKEIPNARIRVFADDNSELIGNYEWQCVKLRNSFEKTILRFA